VRGWGRLFALVEALIGAFGLVSLPIFHGVGQATLGLPLAVVFLVTFVLVLLPTMLMGSTLPLLVAFLVRSTGNVGKSVGSLYFVNTIGSAFASALSVVYLLGHQGQKRTVFIAAGFNFTVAVLALLGERLFRSPHVQGTETTKEEVPS
jgi:predicted membrane-bound spermidine synthase